MKRNLSEATDRESAVNACRVLKLIPQKHLRKRLLLDQADPFVS